MEAAAEIPGSRLLGRARLDSTPWFARRLMKALSQCGIAFVRGVILPTRHEAVAVDIPFSPPLKEQVGFIDE